MKWRPTSPADRQLAVLWATVAVAVVVLVALSDGWLPGLPACSFRALTGVACPTCGTTRALEALKAGDVVAAVGWNPLVVLGAMAFVIGGLLAPIWNRRVGRIPDLRGLVCVRVGLVAVLLANWIYLWIHEV